MIKSIGHLSLDNTISFCMSMGTILLAEANDDDVQLMTRAFRKKNMANEIVVACDGAKCLDVLFGTGVTIQIIPSLVILDLKLPKLNGIEVLRAIRANEKTKGLPVIILTTSSEDDALVQSHDFAANSYIRKPVEFEKFLDAVGFLGLSWVMSNEPKSIAHA